jgi:WD40 repeat protein
MNSSSMPLLGHPLVSCTPGSGPAPRPLLPLSAALAVLLVLASAQAEPPGTVKSDPGRVLLKVGERVDGMAFSPDARLVACVGQDYLIRLLDVESGKVVRKIKGHEHLVRSVVFSPDGKRLASGSADRTIRFWDVATGKELRRSDELDNAQVAVRFSADGKFLASGSWGGTLYIWDAGSGKQLRRSEGIFGGIEFCAFSPDLRLAVQASGRDLGIRETASRTLRHFFPAEQLTLWNRAAFSPDGRAVALGSQERVEFFDLTSGRTAWRYRNEQLPEKGAVVAKSSYPTFSPDGRILASVDVDCSLILWETASGRRILCDPGDRDFLGSLAFSPDGRRLAAGRADKVLLLWDVNGLVLKGQAAKADLSATEIKSLWNDLSSPDAGRAYRAIFRLAGAGKRAINFLADRLQPVAKPDKQKVARLIAALDGSPRKAREQATRELKELGELAVPALRKALADKPSLELRLRLTELLEQLEQPGLPAGPVLRGLRAVAVLEQAGGPEAEKLLRRLAEGATEARLTQQASSALQRLNARPKSVP